MRLIACANCHTQYDVGHVVADTIECRCGESVENKPLRAVDATIHRCGSCGAQVGAEAESCDFCGSALVRELEPGSLICPECYARNADESRFCTACGVGFRPEPLPVAGRELPCPDCETLMPVTQVGGVGLNECRACRGVWVPGDHFDAIVSRATEARRNVNPSAPTAPRVTGANPSQQQVRYRKCPECDGFMNRRNYQKSSGVIIDVCRTHGTWLDPDELEQIAGFILSGGATSPTLLAEDKKVAAEAAAIAPRMRVQQVFERHSEPNVSRGLLGLLCDILT